MIKCGCVTYSRVRVAAAEAPSTRSARWYVRSTDGYMAGGFMRFSADKTHLHVVPGPNHPSGQYDVVVYALKFRSIFERDGKRTTKG